MTKVHKYDTLALNNATLNDYFTRLYNIAVSLVHWHNLPSSVSEREIEVGLCKYGHMLYFNDEVIGDLCLPSTNSGKIDIYNIPTIRRVDTASGYHRTLNSTNSVIIWNNKLRRPTLPTIQLFANRLYQVQRAIDVNIQQQKMPYIILCSEQQRLTFTNLIAKYEGNNPFIFGDTTLQVDGIKVLPATAPYIADKLEIEKHQILNDFLTFLGVNNANQDKKERLVADEVSANDANIQASINVFMQSRQQAADEINRMFPHEKPIYPTFDVDNYNKLIVDLAY